MSSKLRIGIIVAIVGLGLIILGIFAMVNLYQQSIQTPDEDLTSNVVMIDIVIASHDLLLGTIITEGDITLSEVPITAAPRDTIDNIEYALGKVLKVDLVKGEMVLDHNLASPTNSVYDVAYILSDDHVLMAVPASDLMSRESIVQRGDIVDLFVTLSTELTEVDELGNETVRTESMTFDSLQRISITAMVIEIIQNEDSSTSASSDLEGSSIPKTSQDLNVKAYLLALDPQDALVLKFLRDSSAIFDFVIRAPTSTGQFDLTPVTNEYLRELYGLEILP